MKKYVVKLVETNCDFEYYQFVLAIGTSETIDEIANKIASEWYSDDLDTDDEGVFEFSNGCSVFVDSCKEISDSAFDEFKLILPLL